jgi:acyl carrier protein
MSAPTPTVPGRDVGAAFLHDLLAWLNRRFARDGMTIDAATPLFAGRLIDSLRVLELIAFTEHTLGVRIPDSAIRMDNFATPERIAAVFDVFSAGSRDDEEEPADADA